LAQRLEQLQTEEAKMTVLMSDAEAVLRHYKDFTVLSEQVRPLLFSRSLSVH
jgi:hypothetical protein